MKSFSSFAEHWTQWELTEEIPREVGCFTLDGKMVVYVRKPKSPFQGNRWEGERVAGALSFNACLPLTGAKAIPTPDLCPIGFEPSNHPRLRMPFQVAKKSPTPFEVRRQSSIARYQAPPISGFRARVSNCFSPKWDALRN